jgi:predicted CoA-binding protein
MDIPTLLGSAHTIAVAGLSDRPERSSYGVAQYLAEAGFHIIPVNPGISDWRGIPAVGALTDIAEHVDIVDVFRRPEFVPAIVHDAVAIGAAAVWLQLGIRNDEAAKEAESAGLFVVQDRCLAVEYSKIRRR